MTTSDKQSMRPIAKGRSCVKFPTATNSKLSAKELYSHIYTYYIRNILPAWGSVESHVVGLRRTWVSHTNHTGHVYPSHVSLDRLLQGPVIP